MNVVLSHICVVITIDSFLGINWPTMSELDCDDELSADYNDYEMRDSDEDTEDASETDVVLKYDNTDNEYTEIKEQDKLATLQDQLKQLDKGFHPEYVRKIRRLEQLYEERILLDEVFLAFESDRIEREFHSEKKSAVREFEERKVELKESLITELEDKKKMIESERISLELMNDSTEPKPLTTRKLRRRPNEPIPIPEKRRRASPDILSIDLIYTINDCLIDIMEDLKILSRATNSKMSAGLKKLYSSQSFEDPLSSYDAKIEDGKLFYDKKWFHRGQNVLIDTNDSKYNATLAQIGTSEIWIKKTNDSIKSKITLNDLHNGKYALDIMEDLKILSRATNSKMSAGLKKLYSSQSFEDPLSSYDAKIEDGKLFYDKKWFHRGQNVLIDTNDSKFNATLAQIGTSEIWIKKTNDSIKSKITLNDLHNGKYALYRRSS
ncbi:unnamed protein product [Medioppia subpectinata]|uniref:Sin3 histone deacetylase corepressor complex component SDS3 n=1 Tax=Medioppia subpectinata TaxID=1979941 RepID=A0A7R9KJG2_9ACAR|nr:unnamed protein product [Medioppia subpectinata]CAG2104816.1 unnamed protein product [Medioppia subpectinata]